MDAPDLPPDRKWPKYMLADTKAAGALRDTYARIAWSGYQDRQAAADMKAAVAWCHANGNPHRCEIQRLRKEGE